MDLHLFQSSFLKWDLPPLRALHLWLQLHRLRRWAGIPVGRAGWVGSCARQRLHRLRGAGTWGQRVPRFRLGPCSRQRLRRLHGRGEIYTCYLWLGSLAQKILKKLSFGHSFCFSRKYVLWFSRQKFNSWPVCFENWCFKIGLKYSVWPPGTAFGYVTCRCQAWSIGLNDLRFKRCSDLKKIFTKSNSSPLQANLANEALQRHNEFRAMHGVPPLTLDSKVGSYLFLSDPGPLIQSVPGHVLSYLTAYLMARYPWFDPGVWR